MARGDAGALSGNFYALLHPERGAVVWKRLRIRCIVHAVDQPQFRVAAVLDPACSVGRDGGGGGLVAGAAHADGEVATVGGDGMAVDVVLVGQARVLGGRSGRAGGGRGSSRTLRKKQNEASLRQQ